MRFPSLAIVFVLAVVASTAACAQASSTPAGWPRSMPAPAVGAAPGSTQTIVQQAPLAPIDAELLAKRFQVDGNEVYDRKTNLTWQRCDFGQSWDAANAWCSGVKKHATTDGLDEAARSGAPGWRLPTLDEISSLMEVACRPQPKDVPPVFAEIERGAATGYYLTSTPNGSGEGVMAEQCFGGSSAMPAGLGRKYVSITRLVHAGAMTRH
jgi:hypothetical protein